MESSVKTVPSSTDLRLDEVLRGISTLETSTIEKFMQQVSILVARRKASHLSDHESGLLQEINYCIPLDMQKRFELLSKKMKIGQISQAEHEELVSLIDPLELKYAERLQKMIELAHLRGISVKELAKQLNLSPTRYDA